MFVSVSVRVCVFVRVIFDQPANLRPEIFFIELIMLICALFSFFSSPD